MKPRTKIVVASALVIVLAALASVKRGAQPNSAGRDGAACCPFMLTADRLAMFSLTNGTAIDRNPALVPGTNLTPTSQQP